MRSAAGKLRSQLDFTDRESVDKNIFYKAVLTVIDAVHTFALRYSRLAVQMAETETDAKRKEELLGDWQDLREGSI